MIISIVSRVILSIVSMWIPPFFFLSIVFFFNDPATTEIYTLSLHDALPIFPWIAVSHSGIRMGWHYTYLLRDRKSTRLNSSHSSISYAVFCLKKKTTPPRRYKL